MDSINEIAISINSHKIWNIRAHKLIIDVSIIKMLEVTYLRLKEFKNVAIEIDKRIAEIGYACPPQSILLTYSPLPNPDNFLACQAHIKIKDDNFMINNLINIYPDFLSQEINEMKEGLGPLGLKKNEQKKYMKKMIRGNIGVRIAHELSHALGIGLMNDKFKSLEPLALELLTDSFALLSSLDIYGKEHAVLGAAYIIDQIDRSKPWAKQAIEFANSTINKYKN